MNEYMNLSKKEWWIGELTKEWMDEWMNIRIGKRKNKWINKLAK